MKSRMHKRAIFGLLVTIALGSFASAAVTQPRFHVRADSGVTLNGATVSVWADLSGNGNNATQPSATKQPAFVASRRKIGGMPVIRFPGQKWLDFDGTFLANSPYTVFVVEGRGDRSVAIWRPGPRPV